MNARLKKLKQILADAVAQCEHVEASANHTALIYETDLLRRQCASAAAKAQALFNDYRGCPEPKTGE